MIQQRFNTLLNSIKTNYEQLKPSDWVEVYIKLSSEVSTIQGKWKWNNTPYTREILDTISPYHPAKVIAIMKGSQSGISQGLVINGICWMIANQPGNTLFTSAGDDLSKEMVEMRLDQAIRSAGIDHLIRPNIIKKRNQRTGDTAKYKEFAGGRAFFGGANSTDKLSRQRSVRYGFFDDWDAIKMIDKEQGDLFSLLQKRFSTAKNVMKQYYISTPETRPSPIERIYKMGDQRKWHVPCPKCGTFIELKWSNPEKNGKKYGVDYIKNEKGILIPASVGYICQECFEKFEEKEKYNMNLLGEWKPTKEPDREGYVSYQMSNLIAAPFMMGWKDFANEHIDIYKSGVESRSKLKVFLNQTLGEPWEERKEQIKKNQLAKNTRSYEIGHIPSKLSADDGNGNIIMLTCACDLNGTIDDARLDWEVVAHCASASWYSIAHGSIGTYWPGNKDETRDKLTYRNGVPNNVWDVFLNEIINVEYFDDDGKSMEIVMTAIDTGYMTQEAYRFINANARVVGVKGREYEDGRRVNSDTKIFKQSLERPNLYILEVELLKDKLAEMISLPKKKPQIPGFMNFPSPGGDRYTVPRYFRQYEAEEKQLIENDDGDPVRWKWINPKKKANHFFDVAVYNLALRDIISFTICKELKIPFGGWDYFCGVMDRID